MKGYCYTLIGLAFTVAVTPSPFAQTVTPPSVPTDIEVLAPSEAFLLGRATGTQNYVCQPVGPLGRVAWTLFTPQATLFDEANDQLITHFFGPNPAENSIVRAAWQDSQDTSTVWARAVASVVVTPDAIPWVKLQTAGTSVGPTGGGTLARTTFIQRVNTRGGLAPPTGCERLADVGGKAFVPYTADYFFYRN
jgi:hypothetical protein